MNDTIVIIGGGHAAAQLCTSLVDPSLGGLARRVHLVAEEPQLPYQRPPLSKAYLKNPAEALQEFRNEAWFAEQGITLHRGSAATAIDRTAKTVTLANGTVLPYGQLVLATGTRARWLPGLTPDLANVAVVRTADDAQRMRALLDAAQAVTVLGGGFIGLEIAATAQALGKTVTVLEAAPRLLARALSPEMAQHVLDTHRAAGIDVRVGVSVGEFATEGGRLASLAVNGERHAVDLLVLGVGAVPETALAEACGLECANGVVVDAQMRTSDPAILAIGDCTSFPAHGLAASASGRLRLESVQNANDQAKVAAATLAGREASYAALPWFWSEQGTMRLQMCGLMPAEGTRHRRPGANAASFSILHYAGEKLVCVETVNAPMDHMMARKILEAGKSPAPEVACDPAVALKTRV